MHDLFEPHRHDVPGHRPHDFSVQVIVGDQSHVYQYEAGGMSCLGGVAFNVIPTDLNGELPLEALSAAIRQGPFPLYFLAKMLPLLFASPKKSHGEFVLEKACRWTRRCSLLNST